MLAASLGFTRLEIFMSTSAIIALLQSALMLLSLAQSTPNLSQSFRDNAVSVAKNAINQATAAIASTSTAAIQTSAATSTASNGGHDSFQISDVNTTIGTTQATISWKTSMPARSRLTLTTGEVYESLNGVGTNHSVNVNIQKDVAYNYHITAKSVDVADLEDDIYGAFRIPGAELGSIENGCRSIVFKDSENRPEVNVPVDVAIRGIRGGLGFSAEITSNTDARGAVIYCDSATSVTYEVYLKGGSIDTLQEPQPELLGT